MFALILSSYEEVCCCHEQIFIGSFSTLNQNSHYFGDAELTSKLDRQYGNEPGKC